MMKSKTCNKLDLFHIPPLPPLLHLDFLVFRFTSFFRFALCAFYIVLSLHNENEKRNLFPKIRVPQLPELLGKPLPVFFCCCAFPQSTLQTLQ